jgi:hypothetical protein
MTSLNHPIPRRTAMGLLLAAAALAGPPAPAPKRPRLVLAIVVDQFRYDYLLRFRADYNGGLARLLEKGAVFTDAHYPQAATVTAVGHSTVLTGATPSVSGIIGNEWFDRASGRQVTSVSDPNTKLVGGAAGATGSSPQRLLVSTLGDEIKMRFPGSKVIGVSIKDRSAILPAGHMADAAYWYDDGAHHWVTSSYYREDLPAWVKNINDQNTYQRYADAQWFPLGAAEGSAAPFCTMAARTGIRSCGSLEATPWGNEMIEEFAERAFTNENLGRHDGIDVLSMSLSANDYVGHAVGPDDPAVRDISIRTDRLLAKLFALVDGAVGLDNTLVVLTADHGVAQVPEVNQARHMPGGRLSEAGVIKAMSEALDKRFPQSTEPWLLTPSASMAYLNLKKVAESKLDLAEVERVAADAARAQEHIARVYTEQELRTGRVQQDAIGRAFSLGFHAARSGDLFVLQEPYYLFGTTRANHGTPYDYDSHVPLLMLGPGIKPGIYPGKVEVNDLAPTLAALLGVEAPSGAMGRILSEALE